LHFPQSSQPPAQSLQKSPQSEHMLGTQSPHLSQFSQKPPAHPMQASPHIEHNMLEHPSQAPQSGHPSLHRLQKDPHPEHSSS